MRLCWLVLLGLAFGSVSRADSDSIRPELFIDSGGHRGTVWKVLFSGDGRTLITVSDDKTVRVWDVDSGEPLRVIRPPVGAGFEGQLFAAALSPDGQTLAVGGYGYNRGRCHIYLLELPSGRLYRVLKGHTAPIKTLSFSPKGERLVSGSGDGTARLWDPRTGECQQVLQGHTADVFGVAFSPNGEKVATASFDQTGRIWNVRDGTCDATLKGHEKGIRCLAWSPDGKTLATGSPDRTVRLWDLDGSHRKTFEKLAGGVTSLSFTADSARLLISLSGDGGANECGLVDLDTGKETVRFAEHTDAVVATALSPDARLAASAGGDDNEVFLWSIKDGSTVRVLKGKGQGVWSAGWRADGKSIAWGNTARFENLNDWGPLERSFSLTELQIEGLPIGSYQRAVVERGSVALEHGDEDTTVVKRGAEKTATLRMNPDAEGSVRCYTLLSSGRAAIGTAYGGIYVHNTITGERVRELLAHTGEAVAVAPSPDSRYLLSASVDQTLRVWDPDRSNPLLSLFFAGNEWVAWTPEGYYATSPGGEKLIGWQVSHGPERMPDYYPASQFRKTLYRPDVIKLLLQTGGTERALAEADRVRGKETRRVDVKEVLPPKVRITAPRPGTALSDAEIEVRASAQAVGGNAVTALRLLVDGRPFGGQAGVRRFEMAEPGEVTASWTVTLTPGKHLLAVQADSAVSQGLSEPNEISYVGGDSTPVELPRLYVLAVGIGAYPGDLKLDYAARDASAAAEAFQRYSRPLFRSVEARPLIDRDANRLAILSGLSWLRREMTQRDYAVVFFSGHGERDADGALYLLPADVDPQNLLATAVAADQMKQALAGLPGKVVFLLDACHAGAIDAGRRKGALTDDLIRDLVTEESGVVAMCSSTGREFSVEDNRFRQGVFTQALLEGLSGKASKSADGAVYLHHLDAYITDRVKELTQGRQHPTTAKPSTIRSFPLAKP